MKSSSETAGAVTEGVQETRKSKTSSSQRRARDLERAPLSGARAVPAEDLPVERPSRVQIDRVRPEIDGGRFPAKRFIDQPVTIEAVLLCDGHEHLRGRLLWRHEDEESFRSVPLTPTVNDIWVGTFQPESLGRHWITVEAEVDRFGTWSADVQKKMAAGQDLRIDLQSGLLLLKSWLPQLNKERWKRCEEKAHVLEKILQNHDFEASAVLNWLRDPELRRLADETVDEKSHVRYLRDVPLQIEPKLSRFSAWYEFFPRSTVTGVDGPGGFREAAERLEYIRRMGFDIVYLPPIHPIGSAFRKGRNNSLNPEPGDVGSPWAIGAREGGHTALHPDLGTMADFERFVQRAREMGMEIALDIAFQCSPDHPYVKDHPEWFKKRPDGTIQYAENPPKKYQDIYPFDFETQDWRSLWTELRDVVLFWVDRGVRVFRVDNPHTKPFAFWEWMIRNVRRDRPDVIFLAEAFTRPHVMAWLGKAGFSQSYTYFSWRNTKYELTQYLSELTQTELIEFFGANFWPNTPDILPEWLQTGGRPAFMQRLILAATLSSNYGIYGPAFELMEHVPVREGSEEYLDSEKYQIRNWDLGRTESLAPLIARINEIRRTQVALQDNRSLRFHSVDNENLIAFSKTSKTSPDGEETILVVVNLDPHHRHAGQVELPLIDWKIDPGETFQVHDLLTDARYWWRGWRNYVELDPFTMPAHVFSVRRRVRAASDFEYFE